MPQLSDEHRSKLDSIVAKMEAAGESDDEIRAVVSDFKGKYAPTLQTHDSKPAPFPGLGAALQGPISYIKNHPVQAGAVAGGLAATPFTGGMSLIPAMATMGLVSAGGAGYGIAADALGNGKVSPSAVTDAQTMATEGALGATGEGLTRGIAGLFRIAAPGMKNAAVSAYERMLKPNKSTLEGMTQFGPNLESRSTNVARRLIEDPNGQISKSGANRFADRTTGIQDKVNTIVDQHPEARGATQHLTDALADGRPRFKNQWAPGQDAKAYDAVASEVTSNPRITKIKRAEVDRSVEHALGMAPDPISVEKVGREMIPRVRAGTARELTQGTYRNLGDRAYGELMGAQTEAHKAAARGGRSILNEAIPEVEPLNKEISQRIDLGQVLDEAVFRSGKHDPIGLGQQFIIGAGKLKGLPASLINRPGIGSPVARTIYKAGQGAENMSGTSMLRALLAARLAAARSEQPDQQDGQ